MGHGAVNSIHKHCCCFWFKQESPRPNFHQAAEAHVKKTWKMPQTPSAEKSGSRQRAAIPVMSPNSLLKILKEHIESLTFSNIVTSYSKEPWGVTAFILSCKFNPIRSQLETVLDFWLVNVCMEECELIKSGHTFGLPAVNLFSPFESAGSIAQCAF